MRRARRWDIARWLIALFLTLDALAGGLSLSGPRGESGALAAGPASPIVIDDFTTSQGQIYSFVGGGWSGGRAASSVDGSGILGGERVIILDNVSTYTGSNTFGMYASVSGGVYQSFRQFYTYGPEAIWWDGAQQNTTTLNPTGLGGVDLTGGGIWNALRIDAASNASVTITITIYTDANDFSTYAYSLPFYNNGVPGSPPMPTTIVPFSAFTVAGGTGANLQNVGAITLTYYGNEGSGPFISRVETHNTTPPTLNLPSDITVQATSAQGTVVTYNATATDPVDGTLSPSCTPASGSTFRVGTTTVRCSVTDSQGNTASGSFKVTVSYVNAPPTVSAGGPYSGVVGVPTALSGTASDPDGDPLSTQWSVTRAAGTTGTCTFADATPPTTTVTCTGAGSYDLTLTANDGITAPVASSTTLTITSASATTTAADAAAQDDATSVTLSATVSATSAVNAGTVTFSLTDGQGQAVGSPVSGAVTNGQARVTFLLSGQTPPGSYTITAAYHDAAGNYTDSQGTATLTVTPGPPASLTLAPGDASAVVGATVTETATVLDAAGFPVADGTSVSFTVNGSNPGTGSVTTTGGQASFSYSAIFPGDDTMTATAGQASATATITWQAPASSPSALVLVVSPPRSVMAVMAASRSGVPTGLVLFQSAALTLQSQRLTSVVAQPGAATIFGAATVDGQEVVFRVDVSGGLLDGTVRLRVSNGFDSGALPAKVTLTF